MERSLASHGQITPLVVRERHSGYEVIDGFKRLRAARALKWNELWVHVADVRGAQAKVQIVHSNRREGWRRSRRRGSSTRCTARTGFRCRRSGGCWVTTRAG
ncbi:ParB N-terminal domain-containing protein [Nannocystis sp.]|uniref:ParB N-terminal domain-containing protein n=1 Tax=Nannocystis sp. TaxID=1962667 RepID=UPI0025DCECF4|nr:ParB N-terminal domain-containing protein [Nannocystis sp.]